MPTRPPLLPLVLDRVPPGLQRALEQEGVPFAVRTAGEAQGRFLLFDSRAGRGIVPAAGQRLIDVDQLRRPHLDSAVGCGSVLRNVDPFEALLDEKSVSRQWTISGINVCEEVARLDKGAIRRELMARLRRVVEGHGGVWLRLAAFPFPYRSAFNFRIDYDRFDAHDFHTTLDAVDGHESATSHFVNAAAYLNAGDAWRRLRGLDVGSHGYWHHTYLSEAENLRNIRRGIEEMQSHGIAASGFAAPLGRYYPQLLRALDKLDISHSSEFALTYDDLPFVMGDRTLVQIPVHPICLGLFLDAAGAAEGGKLAASRTEPATTTASKRARTQAAVAAAVEHLVATARRRYACGEPVFLYGHPTGRLGRYPQLLREVFHAVDGFGAIWKTTMTETADWWRRRRAVQLSVSRSGEQFAVATANLPENYRLGIELVRGRHVALMPLESKSLSFSTDALAYENRRSQGDGLHFLQLERPRGLKEHVRRLIDWERVTPLEEIAAAGWRGQVKRTLRRLLRAA